MDRQGNTKRDRGEGRERRACGCVTQFTTLPCRVLLIATLFGVIMLLLMLIPDLIEVSQASSS